VERPSAAGICEKGAFEQGHGAPGGFPARAIAEGGSRAIAPNLRSIGKVRVLPAVASTDEERSILHRTGGAEFLDGKWDRSDMCARPAREPVCKTGQRRR
jgi:hypothetical protein